MTLSTMFNATGTNKERLDLLEQAYTTLQAQKQDQRRHADEIMQKSYGLGTWQVLVARAEAAGDGPLAADSVGRGMVETKKRDVAQAWGEAVQSLGGTEYKLADTLGKLFAGPEAEKKLADFFAGAAALETDGTKNLKGQARYAYQANPPGVTLDRELAVADIAVKAGNTRAINGQIKKITAMIDDGHFGNKVKRMAWQAARKFGHG